MKLASSFNAMILKSSGARFTRNSTKRKAFCHSNFAMTPTFRRLRVTSILKFFFANWSFALAPSQLEPKCQYSIKRPKWECHWGWFFHVLLNALLCRRTHVSNYKNICVSSVKSLTRFCPLITRNSDLGWNDFNGP